MLSGEWGAAIYYDGIDTDPIDANEPDGARKAMWLTDKFIEPTWIEFLLHSVCPDAIIHIRFHNNFSPK